MIKNDPDAPLFERIAYAIRYALPVDLGDKRADRYASIAAMNVMPLVEAALAAQREAIADAIQQHRLTTDDMRTRATYIDAAAIARDFGKETR